MNYIIYDLEFNQPRSSKSSSREETKKCPFEIIQIGAIKLDDNFNAIGTFDRLVKPTIYTSIHPYIQDLTNIDMDQLSKADYFPKVYSDFLKFIDDSSIFCVWGKVDLKELFRNIRYHKLELPTTNQYIDVQNHTTKHLKFTKGFSVGLEKAVDTFKIPLDKEFHNAFNDAYYTSKIFKTIYNENIVPQAYDMNRTARSNSSKPKVDMNALFRQFEKMYCRKMSRHEKKIIKLAYMMGKTNQFTVDNKKKTHD
ncbi:3'-5' exonuclease [Tepidibacter aestuarii]|uniref:3'-5' exonuclease n=1 Tax=Tepidibacter aestuarii TaxID=2925782 RepID=UPI0020BF8CD4|nr:3'-5' exonuclease [Tepidibacter aestuarii]CAH2213084.1 Inhibitor of the KinA pathway to sporulation, predicted exonuclease [Tepidibacter aestuarii]